MGGTVFLIACLVYAIANVARYIGSLVSLVKVVLLLLGSRPKYDFFRPGVGGRALAATAKLHGTGWPAELAAFRMASIMSLPPSAGNKESACLILYDTM